MPDPGSAFSPSVSPAPRDRERGPARWICPLIFVVTLLAYFPALTGGLLWDDEAHVTARALRPLAGLERIWSEVGATQQYYPLLHTAFWAEHRIWGDHTVGYHLLNVLLHATAACLAGALLSRLAVPGAWFAALLFALHPVCVESVAWISEQKNTLSAVLCLAAALAYLRQDETRRPGWYVLATLLFILALLTKSVVALLPIALAIVLGWRKGRLTKRDCGWLLPWIFLGGAAGLFTAWVERAYIGAHGAEFTLTALQRVLLAARVICFYAVKLAWPVDLMFFYPHWTIDPSAAWWYLFPAAVLFVLATLWRRQQRGLLAGALVFIVLLFPALGFFNVYPFIYSYVADHFQYLASLGLIAPAAAALTIVTGRLPRTSRYALAALLLATLGTLTWRQSRMYRDLPTLYETALVQNPGSWLAHYNLGNLLRVSGQTHAAIRHYDQALQLRPDYAEAENNLGLAFSEQDQPAQALPHFQHLLQLQPRYAEGHNNYGIALDALHRTPAAIAEYTEALRLRPDYADAHYNLGLALGRMGRPAEAMTHFAEAVRLQPDFPAALNSLGNSLLAAGESTAAIARYEQALHSQPDYPEALNDLANAQRTLGHTDEAIRLYQRALQRHPNLSAVHNNLGTALADAHRMTEAIAQFQEAVRLNPAFAAAQLNLAIGLRNTGRLQEAAEHYDEALRLGATPPAH